MKNINIEMQDWGNIEYEEALNRQIELYNSIIHKKLNGEYFTNVIVSCEHPNVYTIGKSGKDSNMLLNESALDKLGVKFFHIRRGGDITYHGPGQIVVYPIIDLDSFNLGLKEYVNLLEEAVIRTCSHYGVDTCRIKGATGVWIDEGLPSERKICAIGVQSSHFVTMHGLAFNVNTDLKYFTNINPCGFVNKGVTSLSKEVNGMLEVESVKSLLLDNIKLLLLEHIK